MGHLLKESLRPALSLQSNALTLLERRYLKRDENGRIIETPCEMFQRVSKTIAAAELIYDKSADVQKTEEEFYRLMANLEFLPNSPTLMNAGTELGQLSACFVLPIEDSIDGIFSALRCMAIVQKSGGGTGLSFSRLRPKGDVVRSTMGASSGPISFMKIFNRSTDVMKQGGRRRGANIGVLKINHPDIVEFIRAKSRDRSFSNFNLSVAVTDDFMKKVDMNEEYDLVNPRTGESVKRIGARKIFHLIAQMAWKTGDPGILFIDEINRCNPTAHVGEIESTNPCGEATLLAYESCNLGSINLSKMVENRTIAWEKLRATTKLAVRFLDNVIDVNRFPLPQIAEKTKGNRKIGLGVMGFADLLVQLKIPYDSEEGTATAEKIMEFVSREAIQESVELAEERGSFPNFKGSVWEKKGYKAMRNATLTTIAPTGSISIIAGCSSGIEPIFAVSYVRNVMEGTQLLEVNPFFERMTKEQGFYSEELMRKIARKGSIQGIEQIPEAIRRIFVTAFDIPPEWQVRMQAAFQRHCDNAVSKTVNLQADATVEDIKNVFTLAYKYKCKGITVFRYGSKKEQVLYIGSEKAKNKARCYVSVHSEYSGNCTTPSCPL